MKFDTDATSWSTPQNSFPSDLPTGREKPVPIGSIITRSAWSRMLNSLSTVRNGPRVLLSRSASSVRLGPRTPMCSQAEAEPGPPLYAKSSGRVRGSAPSFA